MHCQEMMLDALTILGEENLSSSEVYVKYQQVMRWLSYGQDKVGMWLLQAGIDQPVREDSIVVVSGTSEYDLPRGCRKPILLKDSNGQEVPFVSPQSQYDYNVNLSTQLNRYNFKQRAYLFGGNQIGFTPEIVGAATFTIKHVFRPGRLHYSIAPDQSGLTTLQIKLNNNSDTTEPTNRVGQIIDIDDYYNGMYIEIYAGTGIGQKRKITDYAASTRICTISSAWTTQPDTTSYYALSSPFEEELHEAITLFATRRGASKDNQKVDKVKEDLSEILAMYKASKKNKQSQNAEYMTYINRDLEIL